MEVCSSVLPLKWVPRCLAFGNGRPRTQNRPKQTTISPGKRFTGCAFSVRSERGRGADIQPSAAFYRDVLSATVLREGEPTFLRLENTWLTINGGGGPNDRKPEDLASPPRDPNLLINLLTRLAPGIHR